jgi:hypothetical protein
MGAASGTFHEPDERRPFMPQPSLPPWIEPLQQRDPRFVESYMSQREHILKDGAIPAKYKHLMTMMVDALQTHPDGVATGPAPPGHPRPRSWRPWK